MDSPVTCCWLFHITLTTLLYWPLKHEYIKILHGEILYIFNRYIRNNIPNRFCAVRHVPRFCRRYLYKGAYLLGVWVPTCLDKFFLRPGNLNPVRWACLFRQKYAIFCLWMFQNTMLTKQYICVQTSVYTHAHTHIRI